MRFGDCPWRHEMVRWIATGHDLVPDRGLGVDLAGAAAARHALIPLARALEATSWAWWPALGAPWWGQQPRSGIVRGRFRGHLLLTTLVLVALLARSPPAAPVGRGRGSSAPPTSRHTRRRGARVGRYAQVVLLAAQYGLAVRSRAARVGAASASGLPAPPAGPRSGVAGRRDVRQARPGPVDPPRRGPTAAGFARLAMLRKTRSRSPWPTRCSPGQLGRRSSTTGPELLEMAGPNWSPPGARHQGIMSAAAHADVENNERLLAALFSRSRSPSPPPTIGTSGTTAVRSPTADPAGDARSASSAWCGGLRTT